MPSGFFRGLVDHDAPIRRVVVVVAVLSFFASHKLALTLLVVSPIVFFNVQFLLGLMSPQVRGFLFDSALHAFDEIKRLLIFALIGLGLGLLGRAILKRGAITTR